jgi:hypothetical protein
MLAATSVAGSAVRGSQVAAQSRVCPCCSAVHAHVLSHVNAAHTSGMRARRMAATGAPPRRACGHVLGHLGRTIHGDGPGLRALHLGLG